MDYARLRNGGNYSDEEVNGLMAIIRMLPIFGLIIVFWTIYFQVSSIGDIPLVSIFFFCSMLENSLENRSFAERTETAWKNGYSCRLHQLIFIYSFCRLPVCRRISIYRKVLDTAKYCISIVGPIKVRLFFRFL